MNDKGAPLYVKLIAIAIIIVLIIFSIRKQKRVENNLLARGRYTIGVTKGWTRNHRSSKYDVDYTYSVNGVTYKRFVKVSSLGDIKTSEGKYIVKFDPKSPKESRLLLDMEVLRCELENFADTGWLVIPDFVIMSKSN